MNTDDRLKLHELVGRAACALDEGDLATLRDCFARDAVMRVQIPDAEPLGPFEGREAIMALMEATVHQQTAQRRHLVSNLFIDDDAERPRLTSYLALFETGDGGSRLLGTGIYRDEVCLEGGRWVLARRDLTLEAPLT